MKIIKYKNTILFSEIYREEYSIKDDPVAYENLMGNNPDVCPIPICVMSAQAAFETRNVR